MKKKLFLIASMVALFVCLFAISVSAADMFDSEYTDTVTKFYAEDGTTEIAPDWANLDDKTSTAVLKKSDGSFVRVPAYYIFKANSNNQFVTTGTNFDFAWVSTQLGEAEALTLASLVAFEVPNGTKSFSGTVSKDTFTALTELVVPSTVTSLPAKCFRNNAVIKQVFVKQTKNEDGTINGVTKIPDYFADAEKPDNGDVSTLEFFALELDYVTAVGNNAFLRSAIKEIRLEGPITNLNGASFQYCNSLKTISIINTGDIIMPGNKVFAYSKNIETVVLGGISFSSQMFEDVNGLENAGMTVTATNVAVVNGETFKNCTNLTTVNISGPITSIGGNIFLNCTNLENVKITNTLATPATCGNNMCDGRKNLKSVELHGISIGAYSFRNIDGTDMTVKCTNVGYIGTEAFRYAGNITELYISGPFTYVNGSTYRECPKLKKLTVINTGDTLVSAGNGESNPVLEEFRLEGKFEIGSPAFQNNTALKHIYLGTGVQSVGQKAFFKCYALETAYLADTIETIADSAFDMDGSGKQTSASFMFVDENGKMDNTLPASLTFTGGHFLKGFTFANTRLIYPDGYTSAAKSAYDFESAVYPEGFNIVYLGKMTVIDHHILYKHNNSKNITIYLTQNTANDLSGERINVNIAEDGTLSHGTYAGSTTGTLEIVIDDQLQNNIKATEYVKFYFCGSDEVVFVTRVNIPREEGGASSWGNFVSTPVSYAQLEAGYNAYNKANETTIAIPEKHPIVDDGNYYAPTCTEEGGIKYLCVCGSVVKIENVEEALGHIAGDDAIVYYPLVNGAPNYFANAIISCQCARQGCDGSIEEEKENSALFVGDRGYSYEEAGTSVLYRLHVNVDNIKAYSNAFRYGIIVSGTPSTAPITLVDGAITYGDKTLVFEMQGADYEFEYIQAKVTNIGTAQLNCQAYAIDNTVVTYIGHNNVNTLAEIVTYDAIVKAYGTSGETKEN